ncbi:Phospholipid scramblase [Dirofilaria immitis]
MMKMTGVLLLSAVCVVLSLGVKDECMERYKICSAKDRYIMQKICRKNGGLLKHTLKDNFGLLPVKWLHQTIFM